jgi:hypothetical protein
MTDSLASWPSILHSCDIQTVYFESKVRHVVIAAQSLSTLLSDVEDMGYDVVAAGVLPREVSECDDADRFQMAQHILLRP